MSETKENIGTFHRLIRTSKVLYPVRVIYSRLLMIKRNGLVFAWKYFYRQRRGRYSKKNYYRKLQISQSERARQRTISYTKPLCFSILVPLYNTPEKFLREMIESVINQTYQDWQLCLADGSDAGHSYVYDVVKEYKEKDSRICLRKLESNEGISSNTNACFEMSKGEYIVLFDHDDILHESALFKIREAIDEKDADFIYTDEAIFSQNVSTPDEYHFKPDYSPYNLRANNYICHITCFSRALLQSQELPFRPKFDGSQDFDLVLRMTGRAKNIVHVPQVLYYWRCHEASVASDISAKTYCIDAGKNAVAEHLRSQKAEVSSSELYPVIYRVQYCLPDNPLVSVIVWEGNGKNNMDKCIESIRNHTEYSNYEILRCNSDTTRNQCAVQANGKYLVFMESGCICTKDNWLTELLQIAQDEEVGIVGAKVIYKNKTIRDAGITIGIGLHRLAVSRYYRLQSDYAGFMGDMYYAHNVSAVSDSCMMVRKEEYMAVGGMNETLPGWFAGLDFSLKMKERNKQIVLNPYSEIVFRYLDYEKGLDGCYYEDIKNTNCLKERWKEQLEQGDPYYNQNLTKEANDYSVG